MRGDRREGGRRGRTQGGGKKEEGEGGGEGGGSLTFNAAMRAFLYRPFMLMAW